MRPLVRLCEGSITRESSTGRAPGSPRTGVNQESRCRRPPNTTQVCRTVQPHPAGRIVPRSCKHDVGSPHAWCISAACMRTVSPAHAATSAAAKASPSAARPGHICRSFRAHMQSGSLPGTNRSAEQRALAVGQRPQGASSRPKTGAGGNVGELCAREAGPCRKRGSTDLGRAGGAGGESSDGNGC